MPDLYKVKGSTGRWWGIVGNRETVAAAIRVHELEYFAFDIFSIRERCEKLSSKVVFDEFGVIVYHFESEKRFFEVFREVKCASKVLFKAESVERARLYRERRG